MATKHEMKVLITPTLAADLKARAQSLNVTQSAYVSMLIRSALEVPIQDDPVRYVDDYARAKLSAAYSELITALNQSYGAALDKLK